MIIEAIIIVAWFLCGILAFHVSNLTEQEGLKPQDSGYIWLILFGPIILIAILFMIVKDARKFQ